MEAHRCIWLLVVGTRKQEASAALQQLQGAAAVSGLLVNVDKTEVMAHRVKLAETAEKGAWMERFEVKLETRRPVVGAGWVADAKWATWMGCVEEHQAEARAMEARNWKGAALAVILKFDRGMEELENGDELVLIKIGKVGYARDVKYKEDPANRGRRSADSSQWLLMGATARRNHHLVEVRKTGVVKDNVEKVTVKACGGRAAKVCGASSCTWAR